MLHISGGEGRISAKLNSKNGTAYMLSDGKSSTDSIGTNEWIDFTWFGEKSTIRSVDDRRRVRAEREQMGLFARVQRGLGSLQFTFTKGEFNSTKCVLSEADKCG